MNHLARLSFISLAVAACLGLTCRASALDVGRNGRFYTGANYYVGADFQQLAADPTVNYAHVLDRCAQYRINKVRIWGYCYWDNSYFHPWNWVGNGVFDLNSFNSSYWARVRDCAAQANARGINLEYSLFAVYPGDANWFNSSIWANAWNRAHNVNGLYAPNGSGHCYPEFYTNGFNSFQRAFVDKAIAELGGFPNVSFEIDNEFQGAFQNFGTIATAAPWQQQVADYVKSRTPRLVCAHSHENSGPNNNGLNFFFNRSSIDVLNFHYYTTDPAALANLLSSPEGSNQIVQCNESFNVEGNHLSDITRELWTYCATGAYYGMYHDDPHTVDQNYWDGYGVRFKVCHDVADQFNYQAMSRQNASIVSSDPSNGSRLVYGQSGSQYLVYFWNMGGTKTQNNVVMSIPSGNYSYAFFDVRNGSNLRNGSVSSNGSASIPSPSAGVWSATDGLALVVKNIGGPANNPPSVSLTAPSNGQGFTAPANITVSANASDSDGSISKVEFFNGSTLIGTDTSSPYSIAWNGVTAGSYSLTAKATDNGNAVSTSGAANITVSNQPQNQSPFGGSPAAIPGTITIGNYDNGGEGVAYHDVDAANNASSTFRPGLGVDADGSRIGYIQPGEWVEYTVNVATSGTYNLAMAVANPANGGVFHINFAGANKTGSISVPNTGNWDVYQTINVPATLSAGPNQVMQIFFDANSPAGAVLNIKDIVFTTGGGQTPFGGTPAAIPGTITIGHYDNGGEGVAYHDTDASNNASSTFRPGLGVDADGTRIGWVFASEWIEYTVNVASAATYTLSLEVANPGNGGTFHINFDGVNKTGTIAAPNTGSWTTFQTINVSASLGAGQQVMQIVFDSNSSAGAVVDLRNISFTTGGGTQLPYNGTPMAIPGTVAVCKYDKGGEGIAYHDVDAANNFTSTFRPGEGVDGDGTSIGWIQPGEWLEYTVNVSTAGAYTLSLPLANPGAGGSLHINFDGVNKTGSISVPNTGNWGAYQTVNVSASLVAGQQIMQVVFDANSSAGAVTNLKDIVFSNGNPGQTPFSGSPMAVPGTIETAKYDNGGEGVAFHDTDSVNQQSSTWRPGLGVDSPGSGVGWIYAGEWLEYTVNVGSSGTYTISIPVSQTAAGGTMHVSFNGVNVTGSMSIPNTGDWGVNQTISKSVSLNAGTQVMQIMFDAPGSNGFGPGLGNISISGGGGGNGAAIPGSITASSYDQGGEGVAYHDLEAANLMSSTFRPGEGVDAKPGQGLGWIAASEWINYTVNVANAGNYVISLSVSSPATGGSFHVEFGGVNKTGTITVPNTGDWGAFQTITAPVNLSAGTQVMRIRFDTNNSVSGYVCGVGDNIVFTPTANG